jgi:hypothetical protein
VRHINSGNAEDHAQMVKLVDTPASGAGDRKVVEVRVFFWAPIQISESIWNCTKTRESGFLRFRALCRSCRRLRSFDLQQAQFRQHSRSKDRSLPQPPPSQPPQGALEKQYRLSLLQVFAMRQ